MPFPTNLEPAAIRQLLQGITGADRDPGRLALAAYDLIGFGLGRYFGDAKYLSADAQVQGDPLVTQLEGELSGANGEKLKELLEKYGPALVQILLKLLLKV